jgi:hypothetical protein
MKTKIFLMLAALAVITFTSCNKNSDIDQTSMDLADDETVSDAIFEDVFNTVDYADIILDEIQQSGLPKSAVVDSCPLVTIDHPSDAIWPKTITVNYGTLCTGYNGHTRSGKITIIVTGPRLEPGTTRTVAFDDYFINGIKVEGTKVVENMGFNNNQNMVFSVTMANGKLTLPNGRTIERSVNHEREWIAGLITRNIWDDECLVTGTAQGMTLRGRNYVNTITTALHWKRVCQFIVTGVVKIEREGFEPAELNYGDGECDANATLTMGDKSKEILLRYHR